MVMHSSKYINLCKEFEKLKFEAYDKYVDNIAINSKSNPKQFWQFINGKCKSQSLPCKLEYGDKTAVTDIDKANLFAEFFASVYIERPPDNGLIDFINKRNDHGLWNVKVTPEIVHR